MHQGSLKTIKKTKPILMVEYDLKICLIKFFKLLKKYNYHRFIYNKFEKRIEKFNNQKIFNIFINKKIFENYKMIIIKHRVNTSKELKKVDKDFGVEIDLRSIIKQYTYITIHLKRKLFSNWVKNFNHKLVVLNVKEEGLEKKILKILRRNKVEIFFFMIKLFLRF